MLIGMGSKNAYMGTNQFQRRPDATLGRLGTYPMLITPRQGQMERRHHAQCVISIPNLRWQLLRQVSILAITTTRLDLTSLW